MACEKKKCVSEIVHRGLDGPVAPPRGQQLKQVTSEASSTERGCSE